MPPPLAQTLTPSGGPDGLGSQLGLPSLGSLPLVQGSAWVMDQQPDFVSKVSHEHSHTRSVAYDGCVCATKT